MSAERSVTRGHNHREVISIHDVGGVANQVIHAKPGSQQDLSEGEPDCSSLIVEIIGNRSIGSGGNDA